MTEPTRVLPPNVSAAPGYRPLSVLALIAIVVAGAYAVIVTIISAAAFFSGKSLLLPLWLALFPAGAAVVALAARQQIRRSEGTLSGGALATWAWWLSLLFGLGFLAFYVATYLAVGIQARDFTNQWFEKLREGKVIEAFLDTQDPAARKFDKASDIEAIMQRYGIMPLRGRKGPLLAFEDREVVQLFLQGGPQTKYQSLGVKNWTLDKGGYKVWLTYGIMSPLGSWEVQVAAQSSESA